MLFLFFVIFIGVLFHLVSFLIACLPPFGSHDTAGGSVLSLVFALILGDRATTIAIRVRDRFAIKVIIECGVSLGEATGTPKVRVVCRHLLIVLWVLQLDMLIQGAFRPTRNEMRVFVPIRLGALIHGTLIVTCDFGGSTTMTLPLFLGDVKSHPESLLVLSLVRL